MSQQPGGQPWQNGPAPWESGHQQPNQPAHHQQPLPPQMPVYGTPAAGSKTSIWRVMIGVFLGLWLFFISIFLIALAIGDNATSDFDSNFNFSLGSSSSSSALL